MTKKWIINKHKLALFFLLSAIVSLAGVYFSYHTEITSSTAWGKWGNNQAWVGDSARLISLYVFATFLVMISFNRNKPKNEDHYIIDISICNFLISVIFIATATILNFYWYPLHFEDELIGNKSGLLSSSDIDLVREQPFEQVYKPFISYYFYALGLWVGIILPTFLIFIGGFRSDYKLAKYYLKKLKTYKSKERFDQCFLNDSSVLSIQEVLSEMGDIKDSYETSLRNIAQRYLPVLMLVFIGYALGNVLLTDIEIRGDQTLVPTQTDEARSTFAWIFLVFLVICGVLVFYFSKLLSGYLESLEYKLKEIKDYVSADKYSFLLKEEVKKKEDIWTLKQKNLLSYVWETVFKSGSIYIPLLATIALLSWQFIIEGHWMELIPLELQRMIEEKFLRNSG